MKVFWSVRLSAFGEILVARDESTIVWLSLDTDVETLLENFKKDKVEHDEQTQILEKILSQNEIPITLRGTDFQKRVWTALIGTDGPKEGETMSYSNVAEIIGSKNSVRAVATAVGANKISLLIPCHRVIRSNGELGGYRWGVNMKTRVLKFECNKFFS
jgi:AraC family transcriptional regulator of adaptative response/methylated-DNA-[protein]-cysteine methyltransferase